MKKENTFQIVDKGDLDHLYKMHLQKSVINQQIEIIKIEEKKSLRTFESQLTTINPSFDSISLAPVKEKKSKSFHSYPGAQYNTYI